MKQIQLTNWATAQIGLLLSAGVAFLLLMIWPASRYLTVFGTNAMLLVLPLGILGALAGKLLSRTRQGAWFGAAIVIFLWCWWLYTLASNLPLD
jgi:hypothetical protein